jgi:diguanylate cyclase (GGDEF)-like protein
MGYELDPERSFFMSIPGELAERSYPVPENERDRLRSLYKYDVLDTPPNDNFDRLTEIAERDLGVSVAAITFVDEDRQFVKSCAGASGGDSPRDESYCSYTILSDEPMIVEDSREDERFGKNYAVVDGREVRSYAGYPLITEEGHAIGAFCVFSFEPRTFSQSDLDLLRLLRDQAMGLITTHHHEEELRELAHYDSLTGFPKRHRFMEHLETLLNEPPTSEQTTAVGHIDITRFRRVNETLGHTAADEVLGTVASRLDELLPEEALKTRILGDEFLFVLPDVASKDEVRTLSKEVLSTLREPIDIHNESFLFSARIGLSMYPETGSTAENLIRQADAALKETSTEASGSVKFYLTDMDTPSLRDGNLEQDFLIALYNDELTLNYQPKVDLSDRTVSGMEALIRWTHSDVGFVPHPTIISLAETLGVMADLGDWVMETACRQVQSWNQNYDRALELGVNVSALEFQQGQSFVESVDEILERTGFPDDQLIVEITETEAMHDMDFTIDLLNALKNIGVQVAIDDYGTGQSSLEYLARFPDPILKIDRTFIDGVTRDAAKKAIVRSTVNMASELGLRTIAEGVEQEEEEDFLRDLDCDDYQGYYFSKPVEAKQFEERFLRH